MTDQDLKSLLDELNKNKNNELIHLRPLNETVDYAKFWTKKPNPTDKTVANYGPLKSYFIKNIEGTYVAVVLDMEHDLHWYVDIKYRRKGHLTKAMKEMILFHLFQDRYEQRITINSNLIGEQNYKASEKVALSLGFTKTKNDDYILSKDLYVTKKNLKGQNTQITSERLDELTKKINYLALSLWHIQTEIEMKLGNTKYSKELKKIVEEVMKYTYKIDDAIYFSEHHKKINIRII